MRILIFNWRDIKNPLAGGAEVLTHETARRWVQQGHEVTLLTSRFSAAPAEEVVDGVRIVRCGNAWTVYWQAARCYRQRFRGRCDVVIDEVNTLPFFTPWYVREPVVMHFNQMAREVWFYECAWPLNVLGYLLEPWYLRVYRQIPAVAISRSSRHDLLRLGFDQHRVDVIPLPMCPYQPTDNNGREPEPTLLFVGRLKRSKRVDHAIRALAVVRRRHPRAKLWVVGGGDASYRRALERLAARVRVSKAVEFRGQVSEADKRHLMHRADVIVVPSVREGWGLIVSEAHSQGTPAVVYPVPGLVDSTEHQVTGLICNRPTPDALAAQVQELLENPSLRARLTGRSVAAAPISWDLTAARYLDLLQRRLGQAGSRTPLGQISIVVPAGYWDGRSLGCLQNIARVTTSLGAACELITVELKGQASLAEALVAQGAPRERIRTVPVDPCLGEAFALMTAAPAAAGDLLLYVHPNLDMPVGELERLLEAWLRRPTDVLVASRRHGEVWRRPWLWRGLSHAYHRMVRRLFGVDVGDAQTSVKLFRREALARVLPRVVVKGYAFDIEVLAVAHRLGYTIAIHPIRLRHQAPQRRAHVLDMFHLLMDTLAIWYRMSVLRYYDRPQVPAGRLPSVSVVIPCKGPNPYLTECLTACAALDYSADRIQVIVLPDAPCAVPFPPVQVIPTGPAGPGRKRDLALAHCTGELVAFIDDDTVPRRDWLRQAARCFEDPRIAAVGGPAPTPASDSLAQVASGQVYSSWLVSGTQLYRYFPAAGRWVDDYPSCNLFIRRDVLQQAGGFDTAFWPGEDTILCSKITHDLGRRLWYDPDVVVYHHRRALFRPHLMQIRRYAEHRGYFAKRFPATSLRVRYFLPTALVLALVLGAAAALAWPAARLPYAVFVTAYLGSAFLWGMLSLNFRMAVLVWAGIVVSHWTYGIYFVKGLLANTMVEEGRA